MGRPRAAHTTTNFDLVGDIALAEEDAPQTHQYVKFHRILEFVAFSMLKCYPQIVEEIIIAIHSG